MVPDIIDPLSRIDAVLATAERRIASVFYAAIEQLRGSINLNELASLLEAGRFDEAFQRLVVAGEQLANVVNAQFVNAANSTANFLQNAGVIRVGFDLVNYRAVAAMQARSLRLVSNFTDGQRDAARAVMTAGVQAGVGPREQARAFRDVVGLTEVQATQVMNYRAALERVGDQEFTESEQAASLTRQLRDGRTDRTVQRYIRERRRLPRAQIDRMVNRYSERQVKYRAEVIARTEALGSVHQGTRETYAQAIERGEIAPDRLEREWHTSIDGRERRSHRMMYHQIRGWDEPFLSLSGPIMYPGDPEAPAREIIQCRCMVTTRIKALRRAG